ncbi:hypothetical protein [Rickettsia bellii]|uniref:Uncharacterized protein n=1 Tax=Rickettsia bellii str. RML Mogi TaxID=1359194 RepID=A0A0F3QHR6_RICBE|nr:hypothetical protein [Rickettsia bellii]KJV92115.1 hypothetical protein RBEMOGI_0736 [Rickettsia bellii str. RML Mogi]
MQNQDTNYKTIIRELEKSYDSYIKNKEIVINVVLDTVTIGGGLVLTTSTVGVGTALGITILGSIIFSENCIRKVYKKKLLNALSVGKLGDVEEIEKYYKQLPKKLREDWSDANFFPKLADHLKEKFFEDKIYSFDKDNNFNSQELDDFGGNDINDDWVSLTGNDKTVKIISYDS